ncbi:MAG: FMN-binding glutamate synthase family protein [Nanoarchaeota archaeon]|nr:FMN-binding glutamate synthase family protein [Nanoarchaeota archaeon]
MSRSYVNIEQVSNAISGLLYTGTAGTILAGITNPELLKNPAFLGGTTILGTLTATDFYQRYIQTHHSISKNFGIFGLMRYFLESFGPEIRQYFIANDREELPFNRNVRRGIYRRTHDDPEQSVPFGTLEDRLGRETFLPSFYPKDPKNVKPYRVTFGEERGCEKTYTITHPVMISAMSFGALGGKAIQALGTGAKKAGIPFNTGEGGLSPYHLYGGSDITFEMGTGKFGCRNLDSSLNEEQLRRICSNPAVKMVEIKFSQGAKPGSGGILPAAKLSREIADVRGVPMGQDCVSPVRHIECDTPEHTADFVKRVQNISGLPVGMKMALTRPEEFRTLIQTLRDRNSLPDYLVIDGAEGGTGAAPQSFLDSLGILLFPSLDIVTTILKEEHVRDKLKLVASGKLVTPELQLKAFAYGVDAIYTARGFLFALGCIQAMECNKDTCPAGITTHNPRLQRGLDIEDKGTRVANYVKHTEKELIKLLAATGHDDLRNLDKSILHIDGKVLA